MDDLQLLRTTRNDVGAASEEILAPGRQKLMAHIGAETTAGPTPSKAGRRTMLRRGLLVSAAAAVLVGAIVVADVVAVDGKQPVATASAAEVLDNAAAATIRTSDPVVGPGQYLKIATTAQYRTTMVDAAGKEATWLDVMTDEKYIPANRSDEWVWNRSARVPTTFFDEASKEKALADYEEMTRNGPTGELLRGVDGKFYGTPEEDVAATAASLPRDPRALLDAFYQQARGKGPSPEGEALVLMADLLRTGRVPADLRAALYKAAALIPGITIVDEQATLNGRTGIAIGRVEPKRNTRQDIIIDPDTGMLIGERQVLTAAQGPVPAGTAVGWTAIQTSVVDSAP
ncbi:CU044_5270 family protein [Pseudarthrobacter sp. P1]|uniref:CU044_5270 family protein n=1 Tax=Pseudarthrobacter sp. P1 TaxID=3418418 RepID=UPI003CFB09FA